MMEVRARRQNGDRVAATVAGAAHAQSGLRSASIVGISSDTVG